jgi:hypothetical protein
VTKVPCGVSVVPVPAGDSEWHPIARDWYASLAHSGQAALFQPSDWATARYVAEAMSRNLTAGRFSATAFAAVVSAMSSLLVTEGDRRRVGVQIERVGAVDADEVAADATVTALSARLTAAPPVA